MRSLICLYSIAALVNGLDIPPLPAGSPMPAPPYMVNNQGNQFGAAPDKGVLNGPVTTSANATQILLETPELHNRSTLQVRQAGSYWLPDVTHGKMPFASSNYQFYRNVKDFGAVGDGVTDDTAAINNAASSGGRCGAACGSTTISGALIYFPPGTYVISSPIVQYYYTQFVGDPNDKPVIKGSANFSGIALIDNDVYIPGGNGAEWYINQNQFYRQIRNFVMDLTVMNRTNYQGGQEYSPTGIHWQVAQATSLQNIDFKMPLSDASGATTAVGIFMENGSGGFVSDLTFTGGNIGFRAGSQQFTARGLTFTSCLTAISMVWDWGFTWQDITVISCYIALDCSNFGGIDGQGTGSISLVDSHFIGVPYAITTHANGPTPNIVIDNLLVEGNTPSVVLISGGATILEGTSGPPITIGQWSIGRRYTSIDGTGSYQTGYLNPTPSKPSSLLNSNGKWFTRSKPQYESTSAGSFMVATSFGISNSGTGDQAGPINALLKSAASSKSPVFFPAGVYLVESTVFIPTGSIIVGEGWSQIMGTGSFFEDESNPNVMVKVGIEGDHGAVEISDMLFTVKGATAGAILLEWNVHESVQGSAGMWDTHFRVGGAIGTNLQLSDCPTLTGSVNKNCMAASMLMHMTKGSSGYFENVWAWVADHDIDGGACDGKSTTCSQIDIFVGRGLLIESQGPSWFYGTAAEHSILYQYQLLGAQNIYLGHMQTETPYFQAKPSALSPYTIGKFPADPIYDDCDPNSYCAEAWALRALNSSNIFIYSAGFYSFFQNYDQTCVPEENCQLRLIQTSYTQGLWLYNIFTKGVVQIASPAGGIPPILVNDSNQSGYTSEIAAYLPLALTGAEIGSQSAGGNGNASIDGSGIVYIDPSIWSDPNPTVQCHPPCTLVMPPVPLSTTTTISIPLYTTSLVQSFLTTRTFTAIDGAITSIPGYTMLTQSTVISIPPVKTTNIPVWGVTITSGQTTPHTIEMTSSIQPNSIVLTVTPTGPSTTTHPPVTTTIIPPPYPWSQTTKDPALNTKTTSWDSGPPSPSCTAHCGIPCWFFCTGPCLFCLPTIGGPPGGGPPGVGPPGGSGNGEDSSSECKTETVSTCSTVVVGGSTSSLCSSTVGCSNTDSSTSTSGSPASAASNQMETWPTDTTENTVAENASASLIQSILDSYYPSTTPVAATSTQAAPSPTATTLVFCYYSQYRCSGGSSCTEFETAAYYWFFEDGSSTCESVYGSSSYIGINTDKTGTETSEESSKYHFPTSEIVVGTIPGATKCAFNADGGSGTAAAADSYYGGVSGGGGVGEMDCDYGTVQTRLGYCFKAYVDYSIETGGATLTDCVQLFTCNWQVPNH